MQVENLQYSPRGVAPIINVSQFDVGRTFKLVVYDGSEGIGIAGGFSVRVDGIKPDGHGFSYDDNISVTNNEYTITTKEQMTVLAGDVRCELRFSKNGYDVGTVNFILRVEPSPINENTIISDTDLPDIIALAETQMLNAEAWAAGTKDGTPVGSSEPQYENNSKWYSEESSRNGEAWAIGERDGEPVTSDDPTYHNNSKYYAQQSAGSAMASSGSATASANSATASEASAVRSESWAVGGTNTRSGEDTNNAKYWAEQAAAEASDISGYIAIIKLLFGTIRLTTEGGNRILTENGDYLCIDF